MSADSPLESQPLTQPLLVLEESQEESEATAVNVEEEETADASHGKEKNTSAATSRNEGDDHEDDDNQASMTEDSQQHLLLGQEQQEQQEQDEEEQQEQEQDEQETTTTRSPAVRIKTEDAADDANAPNSNDNTEMESFSAPTLERIVDIIEYETAMIFVDPDGRYDRWKTLNFFWELYPFEKTEFGRLYLRRYLSGIIVLACGVPPYDIQPPSQNPAKLCLVQWSREDWRDLVKKLRSTRRMCLRKNFSAAGDAVQPPPPSLNGTNPAAVVEEENKRLASMKMFTTTFQEMIDLCQIHAALAPIRVPLEKLVTGQYEHEDEVFMSEQALKEIRTFSDTIDSDCRPWIDHLFRKAPNGVRSLRLIGKDQLAENLDDKPYCLQHFQTKLEHMIFKWELAACGNYDPILVRLKYRINEDSMTGRTITAPKDKRFKVRRDATSHEAELQHHQDQNGRNTTHDKTEKTRNQSAAELARLKKNRDALNNKHGEDPLEESRVIVEKATGRPRKRKSDEGNDSQPKEKDDNQHSPPTEDKSQASSQDSHSQSKKRRGEQLYQKKTSARQLQFDDEDGLDDDDDTKASRRVNLTDVPTKRRSPMPKKYVGPKPDQGIFDDHGKVQKRRRWTDEEKTAVKEGVKKYGIGSWAKIKSLYADILRNRTSVQIKDVWRTMLKKNEVTVEAYEKQEDEEEEEAQSTANTNNEEQRDDGDEETVVDTPEKS